MGIRNDNSIAKDIASVSVSEPFKLNGFGVDRTYQATITGVGAITATVAIEFSNDLVGWLSDSNSVLLLAGTNTASSGFVTKAPWSYARANVTSISGTSARLTVSVGGVSNV
jgi:hypothetical protein